MNKDPSKQQRILDDLMESRRIGRREFIGRAAAAGVVATTASAYFDSVMAATPKSGGHYRQALTGGGTGDVLDPAQTLDSFMINVSSGQLRNNLTEIAPSGQLRGELAESWEASADAATWTFKLRQGVEFHNGKTLSAADVVDSFNHHRGEASKSAAKGIVAPIKEVKADGDVSVVMSLTAPGCPVAGEMPGQVAEAVAQVEGVGRVEVRLTWDPPWTPERMSEDARLALGMF